MRPDDFTGEKFGRLTAVNRAENDKNGSARWKCICDCGNHTIVAARDLKRGHTTSCGCLFDEIVKDGITKRHGEKGTRLYTMWQNMKIRCTYASHPFFYCYGGRGITVCREWAENYEVFRDWALTHGYKDDLTIDRIDVDGNYEPGNCRFATWKEQANNKQRNRKEQAWDI